MPTSTDIAVAVPNGAAALVELAELDRLERRAWRIWIVAAGRLREMDEEDPDYDDEQDYVRGVYLLWVHAWEKQSKARRALQVQA